MLELAAANPIAPRDSSSRHSLVFDFPYDDHDLLIGGFRYRLDSITSRIVWLRFSHEIILSTNETLATARDMEAPV